MKQHKGRRFRKKYPPRGRSKKRRSPTLGDFFPSDASRKRAWQQTQHDLSLSKPQPVLSNDGHDSELDPWQQQAVDALNKGYHAVVDAPTTAGKTRVVEVFLRKHLASPGFQACYTCPVKSLANDKFREMADLFGREHVGITTGDVKVSTRAPLVIATLESYRNSLLGTESSLNTDLVIFDEYHYIQDGTRGSAWEEAMILSHPHTQLLLLSASVDNPRDFVRWLGAIHSKKTVLIQTFHRPVPLKNLIFDEPHWVLEDYLPKKITDIPCNNDEIVTIRVLCSALKAVDDLNLTPTIVYTGKRLSTKKIASILARSMRPLSQTKSQQLADCFQQALKKVGHEDLIDKAYQQLIERSGVAYHHSGLAPGIRVAIETLLKDGLLRVCVATSGLSLGINFSVKSTLVADQKRPGDQGMTPYSSSDVLQMIGRAGRRGKDKVGYTLWASLGFYQAMSRTSRKPIKPQLHYDPSTFLGLVDKGYTLATIEKLYNSRFDQHFSYQHPTTLITSKALQKKIGSQPPLPCESMSAMHAFVTYKKQLRGICTSCPHRNPCHAIIDQECDSNPLIYLHYHLHHLQTLDELGQLTAYGRCAKYLPHSGGLLIAQLISRRSKAVSQLTQLAELMASLSLAYYKSPYVNPHYHPPLRSSYIRSCLHKMYPQPHFPYLYEHQGRGNNPKNSYQFIEYHPGAGDIIRQWISGVSWSQLIRSVTNDYFAEGDVFSLITKVASTLQSVHQARLGTLSQEVQKLREYILRPPLDFSTLSGLEPDENQSDAAK